MLVKEIFVGIGEKIRHIRVSEKLTQIEFTQLTGIKLRTLRGYESESRTEISVKEILKITTHERFEKYIFFLMTDKETTALKDEEFLELFENLDKEKSNQALDFMKFLLGKSHD
ncbi:MAG: hypothetical protein COB41_05625 [Proteobacteria bacterium]|nr:MAG: hypothetical protein COB41_05525 [Pseudomonadota bacterium]PCI44016.1 MAG: hypothetical protein COB41_05625 [Pseudomonadota bacterium]